MFLSFQGCRGHCRATDPVKVEQADPFRCGRRPRNLQDGLPGAPQIEHHVDNVEGMPVSSQPPHSGGGGEGSSKIELKC